MFLFMKEVGGEAAVYCNPDSIESISDAIEKVVNNEELRHRMELMSYEQAAKFSYAKAANETLKIYKQYER